MLDGRAGEPRTRRCSSSTTGEALTRFGIYKIVRRHAGHLDDARTDRRVSPHIFRHTAAVHLLEAGVEVNVIRGWLGHADLTTTNRYAEINTKAKIEALRNTEPPVLRRDAALAPSGGTTRRCSPGSHRSDRYVPPTSTRDVHRRSHRDVAGGHITEPGTELRQFEAGGGACVEGPRPGRVGALHRTPLALRVRLVLLSAGQGRRA